MHFEFSPLIVWIALWIVNTYSEFQVNIFSNNRDITKCHSFCTTTSDNDDDKAIAIPLIFSENIRAKNTDPYQVAQPEQSDIVETFSYLSIFCMSEDHKLNVSNFSR